MVLKNGDSIALRPILSSLCIVAVSSKFFYLEFGRLPFRWHFRVKLADLPAVEQGKAIRRPSNIDALGENMSFSIDKAFPACQRPV